MTSLDFSALLREERARRREQARAEAAAAEAREGAEWAPLAERVPLELEGHRVGAELGLESCFYVPDFLSEEEASALEARALRPGAEHAAGHRPGAGWTSLPGRRLLCLGGVPSSAGMFAEPLPPFAAELVQALAQAEVFGAGAVPDQLLVNEYAPGQGIDPHQDGPLYEPMAAIVSLGGPALLDFFARDNLADDAPCDTAALTVSGGIRVRRVASVALEHRSLLVFRGSAYRDLWHGISAGPGPATIDALCANMDAVRLPASWERSWRLSFTVRKAERLAEQLATAEGRGEAARRRAQWLLPSQAMEQEEGLVAAPPPPHPPAVSSSGEPVTLHVYNVTCSTTVSRVNSFLGRLGTGAFHAGVEIYGKEWSFGFTDDGSSGVFSCLPRQCDVHSYLKAVPLGRTRLSRREVQTLILRMCQEWSGDDYDLLRCNCCHFSDALARELGAGPIPKWVVNLAGKGAVLSDRVHDTRSAASKATEEARSAFARSKSLSGGVEAAAGACGTGECPCCGCQPQQRHQRHEPRAAGLGGKLEALASKAHAALSRGRAAGRIVRQRGYAQCQ